MTDSGHHRPRPPERQAPRPPLPEAEYREIYARVPRLTVEVVVVGPQGILLTERASGPCAGLWHVPGGTVRFGEALVDAVRRVAAAETGMDVEAGPLLGCIEYPSHYLAGLDSPVGIAFLCTADAGQPVREDVTHGWFTGAPAPMHVEQVEFLVGRGLLTAGP
jgi:ADP-ribose pyrophosphatase YjhB (NUDIX family)